ncbi:multiple sugar transport system permease protein [Streptomyces sp. LBL]|uniref:carbohydrate ABC transporter permease n=1 Tax=Streptomyces sp. LBL TaxID=2940562 RepID=UPI002476788D|nr:sugar ABC transporter permease [Streptomyces sp. LBL]MDH6622553.1 multiple sugar transport system permease protein [Streptomyces sp. LBL]
MPSGTLLGPGRRTRAPVRLPGPAAPRRRRGDGRAAAFFASPSLIGLTLFTLFPIVMSLVIAFFKWPAAGPHEFTGISNFTRLLNDPVFRRALFNTVLFVVLYLPLNLVVSVGLAVWLTPRIRGQRLLRVLFFLPVVTPMVANVIVWRLIYQPDGLIDGTVKAVTGSHAPNFLGERGWAMAAVVAMSVWQGFGYNMLVFSAALDAIPQQLVDAAQIDGAGPWRMFLRIKLPLISPALFFATTMTLITSFQVFTQPFLLTGGGPGTDTETLMMFVYNQGFSVFQFGLASAAAWILFVLILGVTAVQFVGQRRWVNYDV